MDKRHPSLTKESTNQPATTLSFLENDDHDVKLLTELEKKTEKSVHFALEEESVSVGDLSETDSPQTRLDIIKSWIPSEHLYTEDTFVSESHPDNTDDRDERLWSDTATTSDAGPTYGTSTFIDLESEDETRTVSEYSSLSDNLSSSDVFSSCRKSKIVMYREWKDVTEIVKDIDELEDSEFVTRADTDHLEKEEFDEDDTDVTDSVDDEMAGLARELFLTLQIRRLKLGTVSSPRSVTEESVSYSVGATRLPALSGPEEISKAAFCQKLIQRCMNKKAHLGRAETKSELHHKAEAEKSHVLEHYGLSSSVLNTLKIENLKHMLEKKLQQLDQDTQMSEQFIREHRDLEAELARRHFLSHVQAQFQNKTEERVQSHLIKMHPVQWFSDYVRGLPKPDEDSWEILYKYRTLLEN